MYRFLILMCVCFLSFGSIFAKHAEPIGKWIAPRHCYANDEAYREARRQRREAEDRWIQRNRERERERNRRDRKTKKLLEAPREKNPRANAIVRSRGGVERYRREAEEDRKRRNKAAFDLDVVSPIRNRGIYINQIGDIIVDARLLKGMDLDKTCLTCTVCNKKIQLVDVFSHYKKLHHRFFMKKKVKTT